MQERGTENLKEIYLAGGCFWGTEKYVSLMHGVKETQVGYANGNTLNPSYEQVCRGNTGHAETVKVLYNAEEISLEFLLRLFFESIDPTSRNRQGADRGEQYRTGIYYTDPEDEPVIRCFVAALQKKYNKPVVTEVLPLQNYCKAESYHQKFLQKQPNGYCHINRQQMERAALARDPKRYYKPVSPQDLKGRLTEMQYEVTQNSATEPPFANAYYDNRKEGIYVDITTGEPLFTSKEQFDSGCGWPSFTAPISAALLQELQDKSYGMKRVEVRAQNSNAHLGHVFADGPVETGGLRYCINSAALRFIPLAEMEAEGYGYLLPYFKK